MCIIQSPCMHWLILCILFLLQSIDYQDSEDLKKSQDIPKIFYEKQPKLHEIDRIECNGKVVKVIEMSAAKWEKIATRLYFEPQHIETIKRDSHKSEEACRNVFVQWLEGRDYVRKPLTWKTLITVLIEAEISNTAGDLEIVLKMISSQNAEQWALCMVNFSICNGIISLLMFYTSCTHGVYSN